MTGPTTPNRRFLDENLPRSTLLIKSFEHSDIASTSKARTTGGSGPSALEAHRIIYKAAICVVAQDKSLA